MKPEKLKIYRNLKLVIACNRVTILYQATCKFCHLRLPLAESEKIFRPFD